MSESQKWIAIGVGLAALATAGFMLFRSGKADRPETEEEEVQRVHFISASSTQAELDKQIEKWTSEQVEALLAANPNKVLQTFNFSLSREDFLDVTNVAQNYTRVRQFTKRRAAQQTRLDIIKAHGFESSVYLAKLIEDQRSFESEERELFHGVITKLNINDKIYEVSFESFVGDEETIDLSFVKAHMELLSYHPVKQQTPTDPQTGKASYFAALQASLSRFQKGDTMGAFPSVTLFIQCFDQAVLDYALFHSGLAEEDVRQTAFELDLLQAEEAKDVFAKVAAEIVKHLEGGDEDPEPQEEEELAAESGVQPQYDQN